jgi:ABC-type transport system involved in multi-copper enzyme maturation permease subunit
LAGGLLVAAFALFVAFRDQLGILEGGALAALGLLGLTLLVRRGWLRLFGPVLFYDLLRMTRRSRYFMLRCFYASLLVALFYWLYVRWSSMHVNRFLPLALQKRDLAEFAEMFFNAFMALQFLAVAVLTPVYVAGSIAEEKGRRTLEFVLATDLRDREIVLSKLVSRLASLTLLILTGLPVLSVIQFLGGVDPGLVLAGFAATAITMASLAGVSILASVYARQPRDAIVVTYLAVAGYVAFGYVVHGLWSTPTPPLVPGPRGVMMAPAMVPAASDWVTDWLNAGNLPFVLTQLQRTWSAGTSLAGAIGSLLPRYLVFHVLVGLISTTWAVARVRRIALRQLGQGRLPEIPKRGRRIRPPVRVLPMVWKEVFADPGFRLTKTGRVAVGLLVVLSLAPAGWMLYQYLLSGQGYYEVSSWSGRSGYNVIQTGRWSYIGVVLNPWVRLAGTAVACLLLLGVAIRGATSITGERERDTLDGLLTSPLYSHDILFAKWLGSLLSVRWGWLWLGLIWGIGVVTGALHPVAIMLCSSAWVVYASTLAGIGVWFSTSCPTSLRATLWTLGTTMAIAVGHWALWFCCLPLGSFSLIWSFAELEGALTPPVVLYWMSAASDEVTNNMQWDVQTVLACFGLFAWAIAALFLWTLTRRRFRALTARLPYRRPEIRERLTSTGWGPFPDDRSSSSDYQNNV